MAIYVCVILHHSVLLTNSSATVQELRELVAGIILSDPDRFSTVMLGRSNEEYAEWIMKDESWGGTYATVVWCVLFLCNVWIDCGIELFILGAIELSILSDSYETELHVVDIQTNRIDKFGICRTINSS